MYGIAQTDSQTRHIVLSTMNGALAMNLLGHVKATTLQLMCSRNNPQICALSINTHCTDCDRRLTLRKRKMKKTISHSGSKHVMTEIGIVFATVVLVAACASAPPPIVQMAVSRAAVSDANRAGANELAPVQLRSATDKMASAETAMTAKNYEVAKDMAEQAEVDAKLAEATARSVKAQKAADAVQEDNRVLRKEIDRKSK
jgi:hypothetical protein